MGHPAPGVILPSLRGEAGDLANYFFRPTKERLMGMRKTVLPLFSMAVAIAIVVSGCSDTPSQNNDNSSPKKRGVANKGGNQKPTTVIANSAQQPTQGAEGAKDSALAAAQDYYAAAATGNYHYTYNALSSYAQSQFTEHEWVANNVALGSDTAKYSIDSVRMVGAKTAEVHLTVISADGSSSERTTQFVLENGSWKHELTQAEYDLFADATAKASASPTASPASHSASPSATPNPSPNPSPNRNNDAPNPNVPGNTSLMSPEDCRSEGGTPVPPGTDGDGDDDGCAGE